MGKNGGPVSFTVWKFSTARRMSYGPYLPLAGSVEGGWFPVAWLMPPRKTGMNSTSTPYVLRMGLMRRR